MNIKHSKESVPPFGWKWVYVDGERQLDPVDVEQRALIALIRLRSLGETCQSIADKLVEEGVLSKTGERFWSPQTIEDALASSEAIQLAKRFQQ
jgi:cytosine/adenosine deaminase-related metal-dependent hydrolase